jgi:glycosyltransferase involved in cell wall biosynthesis
MKKVYAVKTYYPHWGEFTGFNKFRSYIDEEKIQVKEKSVPMGSPNWLKPLMTKFIRRSIPKRSSSVYSPNDWLAELSLLGYSLLRRLDIVHIFDAEHTLRYLPFWLKRFGKLKKMPKIIAMLHQPAEILEQLIDPAILAMTDCLLVVSPCQKEYLQQLLPNSRVELLPLAVDTDHFTPATKLGHNGKFRCLSGGVWLRDYQALIDTARRLQQYDRFEFNIVTANLEIPSDLHNIVVHSGITDQAFLELYRTSDILFMPMKAATANNVILEGISCGLPVLSTDLSALRFYVPGDEAVLIKHNDPDAFAHALLELADDTHKLIQMSYAARRRSLELSWTKIIKDYEAIYLSFKKNGEE